MKKTLVAAAIAAAFTGPVFAETFHDSAPVMSVRPVTERTPVNREECWSEQRRGYEERRVTRQDTGAPIGPATVLGSPAATFGALESGLRLVFVRGYMPETTPGLRNSTVLIAEDKCGSGECPNP